MTRTRLIPGPDHPITVEPEPARVVIRVGDRIVADSTAALSLREAGYPPVRYVPLADVDPSVLRRTDTSTYCPYKGDASYYSVVTADGEVTDAAWTYDNPYPAVAPIGGHLAFYPNRVSVDVSD